MPRFLRRGYRGKKALAVSDPIPVFDFGRFFPQSLVLPLFYI